MHGRDISGKFVFEPPEAEPAQSALYDEHLKLTKRSHIAPFAGYLMPLWYSSISAEHAAVRNAAGLFDCTHMGVLEVSGSDATAFLDSITTNNVATLEVGRARYSYILDAAGNILDDIIIYAIAADKYMVVVNAANEPKIKAYIEALTAGKAVIDAQSPEEQLRFKPVIRDMKDPQSVLESRVDLALQGPASTHILVSLIDDSSTCEHLSALKPFRIISAQVAGLDCLVSRTGYTGAKVGFELFVHPNQAPQLWNALLAAGEKSGLLPCGLGARDSLRIEAGLPLYGHELAGDHNISPFEAGYGWAVKLQKDFFIGKPAMQQNSDTFDMNVVRIEFSGARGVRPVRQNDPVLDEKGACIGWVLSSAKAGETQVSLAFVQKDAATENDPVGLYYLARSQGQIAQGRRQNVEKQQVVEPDITGAVVSRFAKF